MTSADLESRFTYHAPTGDQPQKYVDIRQMAKAFAYLINQLCPEGREKSLAVTKLEESVFWANAAIARAQEPLPKVPGLKVAP